MRRDFNADLIVYSLEKAPANSPEQLPKIGNREAFSPVR